MNPSSGGSILSGNPVGSFPLSHDVTSWAGPFTTGRVFVSAPAAFGGASTVEITGGDARDESGHGSISRVSGTLSRRIQAGDHANASHIALVVPEPSAVVATAIALATLLDLRLGLRTSGLRR